MTYLANTQEEEEQRSGWEEDFPSHPFTSLAEPVATGSGPDQPFVTVERVAEPSADVAGRIRVHLEAVGERPDVINAVQAKARSNSRPIEWPEEWAETVADKVRPGLDAAAARRQAVAAEQAAREQAKELHKAIVAQERARNQGKPPVDWRAALVVHSEGQKRGADNLPQDAGGHGPDSEEARQLVAEG
jgi:hypothetical protein